MATQVLERIWAPQNNAASVAFEPAAAAAVTGADLIMEVPEPALTAPRPTAGPGYETYCEVSG